MKEWRKQTDQGAASTLLAKVHTYWKRAVKKNPEGFQDDAAPICRYLQYQQRLGCQKNG